MGSIVLALLTSLRLLDKAVSGQPENIGECQTADPTPLMIYFIPAPVQSGNRQVNCIIEFNHQCFCLSQYGGPEKFTNTSVGLNSSPLLLSRCAACRGLAKSRSQAYNLQNDDVLCLNS